MNLFDYLKLLCNKGDHQFTTGERFPSYMANRYFSFISTHHVLLINHFLNYKSLEECADQDVFDLTQMLLPKTKFTNKMFEVYEKVPERKVDKIDLEKLEFIETFVGCSPKEAEMCMGDSEFMKSLDNYLSK